MSGSDPDIADCESVDQDVYEVVDDDNQPARDPGRCIRIESRRRTFRPWSTARPWSILDPRDVAGQVPAIDDEVRAADDRERQRVLCNEKKRQDVEDAMHGSRQRTFRFLAGHPLTLQQVVAYPVSHQLVDRKHARG